MITMSQLFACLSVCFPFFLFLVFFSVHYSPRYYKRFSFSFPFFFTFSFLSGGRKVVLDERTGRHFLFIFIFIFSFARLYLCQMNGSALLAWLPAADHHRSHQLVRATGEFDFSITSPSLSLPFVSSTRLSRSVVIDCAHFFSSFGDSLCMCEDRH